jgi:hypothetical protein
MVSAMDINDLFRQGSQNSSEDEKKSSPQVKRIAFNSNLDSLPLVYAIQQQTVFRKTLPVSERVRRK